MNDADKKSMCIDLIRDVGIAVQESSNLLSKLYVDRGEHRHFVRPYEESTAKRYFLSQCLMDVQTSVGAQLRLIDHLRRQEELREPDSEGIRSITLASIIAEQSLWRRRLAEALARLVLFSTTDTDAHYFHYLLLGEADENEREVGHLRKDFGATSATLARRAENIRTQLSALSLTLPLWYAQRGRRGRLKPAPATDIIRAAVIEAVALERTALGYSYLHSFSSPSQILHFSTSTRRDRSDQSLVDFGTVALMLLSTAITTRVGDLAGLPTTIKLNRLATGAVADLPEVGDFVVVTLDPESIFLAEAVSTGTTVGIIGRVGVRFIGAPPYPDISEDEFPSDLVCVFMRFTELKAGVLASLPSGVVPSEAELRDSCRSAVEQAWNLGIRDMCRQSLRAERLPMPSSP